MGAATRWNETRVKLLRRAAAIMDDDEHGARILSEWLGEPVSRPEFYGARRQHSIPSAPERKAAELAARLDAATETDESRLLPPPAFLEEPEQPPADRTYVERPVASRALPPLDLGGELERIVILPDTHVPFEDKRAWDVAMRAARAFRPHTLCHLGDFLDCYPISAHDRDPRRGSHLSGEIGAGNERLDELDSLGAARKVFTKGNHEDRLRRYMERNAPAIAGMVDLAAQLRLQERGWQVIEYGEYARVGKMHLSHEMGYAGVHAVRNTALATMHNVVFGHTHMLGVHYFGSALGDRYVAASLGWLGDMAAAKYANAAQRARWQLGFGLAHMDAQGRFHLQAVPIVDYRCVLDSNAAVIE